MWVSAEQGNSVVGYKSLSFRFGGDPGGQLHSTVCFKSFVRSGTEI